MPTSRSRRFAALALVTPLCLPIGGTASAAFIDDFDDASNLNNRDATSVNVLTAASRATFTRNANGFTVIDFYEGAAANGATGFSNASSTFDLATEGTFTLVDGQRIGDGFYSLTGFFFDENDNFLGERFIEFDSAVTGDRSFDVNSTASGVAGAAAYNVGVAIIGDTGSGFSFDAFSAVPEPASAAVLGLGGLLLARRRR